MPVRVRVPASSANLGPGFDVLGLALSIHNTIELDFGVDELSLTVTGEGEGLVDRRPAKNLAVRTIKRFYERAGAQMPPLAITMNNRIPLSRGLGSSAATIVGALLAANELSGAGWRKQRLFDMAMEIEGHADNVAAALYGGLTIAYRQDHHFSVHRCEPAERIGTVVLIPDTPLSTAKARAVLPRDVPREAAVFNIARVGLLVDALLRGDIDILAAGLEDEIHQPWRRTLIDDYDTVVEACSAAGAVGTVLSGAGPTLIAFYDRGKEADFRESLTEAITQRQLRRVPKFVSVDREGAVVEPPEAARRGR